MTEHEKVALQRTAFLKGALWAQSSVGLLTVGERERAAIERYPDAPRILQAASGAWYRFLRAPDDGECRELYRFESYEKAVIGDRYAAIAAGLKCGDEGAVADLLVPEAS